MRNAVADYLKKKKEGIASVTGGIPEVTSPIANISPASSHNNESSSSPSRRVPHRRRSSVASLSFLKEKQPEKKEETKMERIMKLIHANSMFMHVHSELFYHDRDDFPSYLELVHNTDDDSLLLFLVDDPRDCIVTVTNLADITDNEDWLIIQQRYGRNAELILCNIETIFRSREFLLIVRKMVARAR